MSEAQISGGDGEFQISGELSFSTVNEVLKESLSRVFAQSVSKIEMDLSGVSRADSAGLALLIQWMRMAGEAKSVIRFHHLPEQLLAIAHAGELDTLLPIAE